MYVHNCIVIGYNIILNLTLKIKGSSSFMRHISSWEDIKITQNRKGLGLAIHHTLTTSKIYLIVREYFSAFPILRRYTYKYIKCPGPFSLTQRK